MTPSQWDRIKSEIEDLVAEEVSDAETAAAAAERERAERDCGHEGVFCAAPPGCGRHWAMRNRQLVAERDAAMVAVREPTQEVLARIEALGSAGIITPEEVAAAQRQYARFLLRTSRIERTDPMTLNNLTAASHLGPVAWCGVFEAADPLVSLGDTMIVNINRLVTVTLTDAGRDHYRAHLLRVISAPYLSAAEKDLVLRTDTPGEDGKISLPLWRVFEIFSSELAEPNSMIAGSSLEIPDPTAEDGVSDAETEA